MNGKQNLRIVENCDIGENTTVEEFAVLHEREIGIKDVVYRCIRR